nr:glutamate--tRNA ligase [Vallitaleaceae bacterium]
FNDEIYGKITVDNSELDDMILMKSDGFPTYNFANVVDDHLMEITHVVRGNEYLSSSPKYNRLYEAFGWEVPVYIHCPLITDEENHKLSKRSGHASYEDLTNLGYLDETIVNYVALLGWSPDSNEEIFSIEELIRDFDYRRINKSPAVFDMKKFTWMNSEYIKHMDPEAFYKIAEPQLKSVITKTDMDLTKIAALVQTRLDVINDIPSLVDFFEALPEYDIQLHNHKRMKTNPEVALENLKLILPVLEGVDDFSLDNLHQVVLGFVESKGMKNGQMLWPLRTALSGKPSTPGGAFDIADILGKEESISRIKIAIDKLETEIK